MYGARLMATRAVFFLSSGGYELAWQCTSLALTAAAMGDDVVLVFGFDALRDLARDSFGKPLTERERSSSTRAEGINAPTPARMLNEARSLGARVLACDTTVRLCGLVPADLETAGKVDEVMGLPQIWSLARDARVLSF